MISQITKTEITQIFYPRFHPFVFPLAKGERKGVRGGFRRGLLFALCSLLFAHKAWAQAQQPLPPSPLVSFLPLLVIFGIFYFLLIRPQQKKMKVHRQMIENLKKGDKVITSSGFWATIAGEVSKEQEFVDIEIAKNVRVRILKNSIAEVRGSEATIEKPVQPTK